MLASRSARIWIILGDDFDAHAWSHNRCTLTRQSMELRFLHVFLREGGLRWHLEEFSAFPRAGGFWILTLLAFDGLGPFFAVFSFHFSDSRRVRGREPSMSRARGGRDAGSLTPRCSVTPIGCMHRNGIWKDTCHKHRVRTTTRGRTLKAPCLCACPSLCLL